MIHTFARSDTEGLFQSQSVPRFRNIERVAQAAATARRHRAGQLEDPPPGNQLEALKGDRKGQHSIRINDHWRLCFVWKEDGAHRVDIVDYH
jgi:proteic killer suppression protein